MLFHRSTLGTLDRNVDGRKSRYALVQLLLRNGMALPLLILLIHFLLVLIPEPILLLSPFLYKSLTC